MNERAGTTGSAGMDEAAGTSGQTPMGAAEAAEIMADAAQRAQRQFRVSHRVAFTVWGLGLLLGYGSMWLTVRGQRLPHGPDLATFAAVTLLGVGSVMSGVNEARADSGVGGLSAIRRRASFLSVLIGLAAMFALGGALAHAGASQAVISVFEASAPVLVAGLFYLSTSIVQLNWPPRSRSPAADGPPWNATPRRCGSCSTSPASPKPATPGQTPRHEPDDPGPQHAPAEPGQTFGHRPSCQQSAIPQPESSNRL